MGGKTLREIALACASLIALGALVAQPAQAVSITYAVDNESGSTWVYSYTLSNDSLAAGISEFRIIFALGDFENLEVAASPPDWDPIVAQPDSNLPDDGYVDWLGLAGPLAFGDSLFGFQMRFTWLGTGTPGAQPFSVLDPNTFETLFAGRTALAGTEPPPTGVPEPGTLGLLAISLVALVSASRRRRIRILS